MKLDRNVVCMSLGCLLRDCEVVLAHTGVLFRQVVPVAEGFPRVIHLHNLHREPCRACVLRLRAVRDDDERRYNFDEYSQTDNSESSDGV